MLKKQRGGGQSMNMRSLSEQGLSAHADLPQYKLYECFLGDSENETNLYIEKQDGSSKLKHSNNTNNTHKICTLDSLMQNSHFIPHFIKIDTDGFDFKVLRGAKETLKAHKSALFFEWDQFHLRPLGEDPLSIFSYLYELGYKECLIFDNFGRILCQIQSNDRTNLALLMDYTLISKQHICYYDVLTFHSLSGLCVKEYLDFIQRSENAM